MSKEKLKKSYKKWSKRYDKFATYGTWWIRLYSKLFWGITTAEYAEKAVSRLPGDFDGTLLDIPVGTAVFTHEKYARMKNAQITCMDYSEDMLGIARERLDFPHIKCMQGDVGELPFPDESFDKVLCMNGFQVFPDKYKSYSETYRVLKKGGELIGTFMVVGERKSTDWVIKHFYIPMGIHTPPHWTYDEFRRKLESMYSHVELYKQEAMITFRCIK